MRTVKFGCDRLLRSCALLQLKKNGGWHRISIDLADFLVRNRKARLA